MYSDKINIWVDDTVKMPLTIEVVYYLRASKYGRKKSENFEKP